MRAERRVRDADEDAGTGAMWLIGVSCFYEPLGSAGGLAGAGVGIGAGAGAHKWGHKNRNGCTAPKSA